MIDQLERPNVRQAFVVCTVARIPTGAPSRPTVNAAVKLLEAHLGDRDSVIEDMKAASLTVDGQRIDDLQANMYVMPERISFSFITDNGTNAHTHKSVAVDTADPFIVSLLDDLWEKRTESYGSCSIERRDDYTAAQRAVGKAIHASILGSGVAFAEPERGDQICTQLATIWIDMLALQCPTAVPTRWKKFVI